MSRVLRRWLTRVARPDSGFTIVEVMIASGLMLSAIFALLSTVISGITATGLSRQRQSASGLANQTIEQVRALSLDRLRSGLLTSDTTGDTNITASGCPAAPCFRGETVVTDAAATAVSPLNPHTQTNVPVGPTKFDVSTYVTWFENNVTSDAFRVSVLVKWDPLSASSGTAQAQTILHYPPGCLSTATRPFSGPCLASFTAQGAAPSGVIRIQPHADPDGSVVGLLAGIPFEKADLSLPKAAADLRVEQIAVANASTRTAGASFVEPGLEPHDVAYQVGVAQANNDPEQPGAMYSTAVSPVQNAGSHQVNGLLGSRLTLDIADGGDTGTATATGSAATPSSNCPNLTGFTNKTDGLPCGASATRQLSTVSAALGLSSASNSLGDAVLARALPQSSSTTVVSQLLRAPVSGKCPSVTDEGCANVEVSRALQDIEIGGLPSALAAPELWNGYLIRLSGFTDSATAAAGVGSGEPTASASAGSLSYWNGEDYTSVDVTSMPSDIEVQPNTFYDEARQVSVVISGTIHGPTTTIDNGGCSGTCTRTTAHATSVPVVAEMHYMVTDAAGTIADLDVLMDPGTLLAGASYAAAPTS